MYFYFLQTFSILRYCTSFLLDMASRKNTSHFTDIIMSRNRRSSSSESSDNSTPVIDLRLPDTLPPEEEARRSAWNEMRDVRYTHVKPPKNSTVVQNFYRKISKNSKGENIDPSSRTIDRRDDPRSPRPNDRTPHINYNVEKGSNSDDILRNNEPSTGQNVSKAGRRNSHPSQKNTAVLTNLVPTVETEKRQKQLQTQGNIQTSYDSTRGDPSIRVSQSETVNKLELDCKCDSDVDDDSMELIPAIESTRTSPPQLHNTSTKSGNYFNKDTPSDVESCTGETDDSETDGGDTSRETGTESSTRPIYGWTAYGINSHTPPEDVITYLDTMFTAPAYRNKQCNNNIHTTSTGQRTDQSSDRGTGQRTDNDTGQRCTEPRTDQMTGGRGTGQRSDSRKRTDRGTGQMCDKCTDRYIETRTDQMTSDRDTGPSTDMNTDLVHVRTLNRCIETDSSYTQIITVTPQQLVYTTDDGGMPDINTLPGIRVIKVKPAISSLRRK